MFRWELPALISDTYRGRAWLKAIYEINSCVGACRNGNKNSKRSNSSADYQKNAADRPTPTIR